MALHNKPKVPPAVLTPAAPRNPAEAFEEFVEMVRHSPVMIDKPADDFFRLLRPFIVNPGRNEAAVREIVQAYSAAWAVAQLRPLLWITRIPWLGRSYKGTMEQRRPSLIGRLHELETMLKTELRPGSVFVHVRPIQYLGTPSGYEPTTLHRYRLGLQTLVDPSLDDTLEAVLIQLTALAEPVEPLVDTITPGPGFSVVGLRKSSGLQVGTEEVVSDKEAIAGEISGGVAKAKSSVESMHSHQESTLINVGTEQSLARVEQYLVARKAGNRALWHVLAGVGPIDAGGTEYVTDLLVAESVKEISISVEAEVQWNRGGTVPTNLHEVFKLPRPFAASIPRP